MSVSPTESRLSPTPQRACRAEGSLDTAGIRASSPASPTMPDLPRDLYGENHQPSLIYLSLSPNRYRYWNMSGWRPSVTSDPSRHKGSLQPNMCRALSGWRSGFVGLEDLLPSPRQLAPATIAAGVGHMGRTHYDVLGITPDATNAVIRAVYKAKIRETHPDNGGDEDEAALVNAAFGVLSDEQARIKYDRTLEAGTGTHYTTPTTPHPGYVSTQHQSAGEPDHYRPTGAPRLPIWRRRPIGRNLLIIAIAWTLIAAIMGFIGAQRARDLDIAQPGIAGFLLAALPALILFLVISRAKWWLLLCSCVGYALFTGSQYLSGIGTVMLIVTIAAGATVRAFMASGRKALSQELAADFWAAAANPDLSAWFIARSMQDRQCCLTQLVDVTGSGRPDTSAVLWGNHVAGTYIITDLSSSPAAVLLTVTAAQMKAARKARGRR
ncbi:hypothetical protein CXR34_08780 [Microbacterium hominis]|uniref:J domain-containing protein n=2 Tax=Microbacteriaceae TaxID=85023 RepID=A0A2K9DBQ2_9MICO|nr:hypothetical protein CXR34_08780 [Microbacterium hominis]